MEKVEIGDGASGTRRRSMPSPRLPQRDAGLSNASLPTAGQRWSLASRELELTRRATTGK